MFIPQDSDAGAFTNSAASPPSGDTPPISQPPVPHGQLRHLLFGTPEAVTSGIRYLHHVGYAEPNDWSRLLPTGREGEVMAILTKRIEV